MFLQIANSNALLSALLIVPALGLAVAACTTRKIAADTGIGHAAYELACKRAMDRLRADYAEGRIKRREFERRKREIEDRPVV